MSDREAFEKWAVHNMKNFAGGLDLSLATPSGHDGWTYATKAAESSWRAWKTSRQALSSYPEIPDGLEPASRKTFEGEPVAIVDRVGIMQRCAPYSNLAEGTKLYTYAEWADAKAGERPMNDNMFKNIKKRSLKSIFDQLLSTAERDTYWNSKEQLKLKLLECGVLASEIQRRVIEDPALAGEPVGYTCKKTIAAARQGARNSLASFYAKSEGDVNVGLYTHPASAQKEIERWKSVSHDQAETISELQGLVHDNHREQASVPKGWTIEPFDDGFGVKGISVLWPGDRGGAHLRPNDSKNSIAQDLLYDLAQALLFWPRPASADVPDLFWNCGDIDSGDRGIDHVVSVIADGMDLSSTDTFPIMRAKRLSDFEVCITVDAEGDVEWKWAEPEQEASQ